jgi:hypothetical protein
MTVMLMTVSISYCRQGQQSCFLCDVWCGVVRFRFLFVFKNVLANKFLLSFFFFKGKKGRRCDDGGRKGRGSERSRDRAHRARRRRSEATEDLARTEAHRSPFFPLKKKKETLISSRSSLSILGNSAAEDVLSTLSCSSSTFFWISSRSVTFQSFCPMFAKK